MAPTMIGPQTAAAEIAKMTAMIAHDHQSLSAGAGLYVFAFTWRAFGMVPPFRCGLLEE